MQVSFSPSYCRSVPYLPCGTCFSVPYSSFHLLSLERSDLDCLSPKSICGLCAHAIPCLGLLISLNRYGLPQLVLPVWFDTYEYAERAKYLGIGVIGNIGIAPGVEGIQFGNKLLHVLEDETIQAKAKLVGIACSKREGREVAAQEIAKWATEAKTTWKAE